MGNASSFRPFAESTEPVGSAVLVDKMIGNAFPVVKSVADNLDMVRWLASNSGALKDNFAFVNETAKDLDDKLTKFQNLDQDLQTASTASAVAVAAKITATTKADEAKTSAEQAALSVALSGSPEIVAQATELLAFLAPGSGAISRRLKDKLADYYVTPQDYGAAGDGVTDDTNAIQRALNTGKPVYLGRFTYKITNSLVVPTGGALTGYDRTKSELLVQPDFNLSAPYIVKLGSSEPGAILREVGIRCVQPTNATRATAIRYPVAVQAIVPRLRVEGVRISGAWKGVDANGNAGGAFFTDLEIGALDTGFYLEGAMDFVHVKSLHLWCFGLTSTSLLAAYGDGATLGAYFGRADGLKVLGLATYRAKIVIADASAGNTSGMADRMFSTIGLDAAGSCLEILGGINNLSTVYSTAGTEATPSIKVSDGITTITGYNYRGAQASPDVLVTNGTLILRGGRHNQNALDQPFMQVTGGTLDVRGMRFEQGGGTRTVPVIDCTGGTLIATDNWNQGATGVFVAVATDSLLHNISNNHCPNQTITLPTNARLGCYGPNKGIVFSFTPVATFTTSGTWAPTYTTQKGRYWYVPNGIQFAVELVFQVNAYTGTDGSFVITGFPVNTTAIKVACPMDLTGVTFQTNYYPYNAWVDTSGVIVPHQQASTGQNPTALTSANMTVGANITMVISGFVPLA